MALPPSVGLPLRRIPAANRRATASVDIADRFDTDELHHARSALRERTDGERPEDVVIEAGHTAELRGERTRIFRRDDTKETVSADRPDPKCRIAVVGGEPAAHHEAGTSEGWIGLASGRHVDGLFGCDLTRGQKCQSQDEDATLTHPTSTDPAQEAQACPTPAVTTRQTNTLPRTSFHTPVVGSSGFEK